MRRICDAAWLCGMLGRTSTAARCAQEIIYHSVVTSLPCLHVADFLPGCISALESFVGGASAGASSCKPSVRMSESRGTN